MPMGVRTVLWKPAEIGIDDRRAYLIPLIQGPHEAKLDKKATEEKVSKRCELMATNKAHGPQDWYSGKFEDYFKLPLVNNLLYL